VDCIGVVLDIPDQASAFFIAPDDWRKKEEG